MPERSPVVFWLLLAATLVVGLALGRLAAESDGELSWAAFDAFVLSMLNVVCIWSATRLNKNWLTRIAPWLAAVVAAGLLAAADRYATAAEAFMFGLAYCGLSCALVLMALWLLQRSSFWRRRTGINLERQFSLATMLTAMTVVAVIAAIAPKSGLFGEESPWLSAVFICSGVVMPVAAVTIWHMPWHWILRTAAVFAVALLLTAISAVAIAFALDAQFHRIVSMYLAAHYDIQAIVLVIWLAWGQILPAAPASADATASTQQS